jgi:hypothetical protein
MSKKRKLSEARLDKNRHSALGVRDALLRKYRDGRYDLRSMIVDALTDMRHLSAQSSVDFDAALAMSLDHFKAELDPNDDIANDEAFA